jgi:DNA primase
MQKKRAVCTSLKTAIVFNHWTADEKGGPIDFVMKYGNVTYPEAVAQLLGERYDLIFRL